MTLYVYTWSPLLFIGGSYIIMAQRNTKLTQEEFLERINQISPNIKIISQYTRRKDRIRCICIDCGNEWNPTADKLLEGRGCPKCAIKKRKQCQSQSNEDFIKKFNKLGNKNVILLEEYTDSTTKIHCKCNICQNEWYTLPPTLLDGHGCPKCGIESAKLKTRKTHEQFIKEFEIFGNPKIEIVSKYVSMSFTVQVRCKECGKIWQADPKKILYQGQGCMDCYRKNNFGENHPHWNPNKTDEERIIDRQYEDYYNFVKTVMKRDNYICQITGQKGYKLVVHHLNGYNWDKENRTNIDNGITLSENIHLEFHKKYGYGYNTKEQFIDFVNLLYEQNKITDDNYNSLINKLK